MLDKNWSGMPKHHYPSRSSPGCEKRGRPTRYHAVIGDPGIFPLGNYVR